MVSSFNLSIVIIKTPINPQNFRPMHSSESADFIASGLPFFGKNRLSLNFAKQELYIFGIQKTSEAFWKKSGRISAIPDLYGAQLFLLPSRIDINLAENSEQEQDPIIVKLVKSVALRRVTIGIADGREIQIDGDKFEKNTDGDGYPVFSIVLPETEEEMQGLDSSD